MLPGLRRLLLRREAGRRRRRVRRLMRRRLRLGRGRGLRGGVAAAAVLPVLRLAGRRGVAVVLVRLRAPLGRSARTVASDSTVVRFPSIVLQAHTWGRLGRTHGFAAVRVLPRHTRDRHTAAT